MKEVAITDLDVDTALGGYICHKSGEILHCPGEIFTRSHRALLHQCGIDTVLLVDEDPEALKCSLQNRIIAVEDIPVNEAVPVTLLKNDVIPVLNGGELFTPSIITELAAEGITQLSFKKDVMELEGFQYENYRMLLESDKVDSLELIIDPDELVFKKNTSTSEEKGQELENVLQHAAIPDERFLLQPSKQITPTNCKLLMQEPEKLCVAVGNHDYSSPIRITTERDRVVKKQLSTTYMQWLGLLDDIFTKLKSNKEVAFESVEDIARSIIDHYFMDSLYCLNLMNTRHPPVSDTYLLRHSLNVSIAATGVGVFLGYPLPLVRELVIGALLHDIGHLLTYRPLLAKKELDPTEQHKYDQHAIVGMAMLKNITKIPISTMLVVSQHHEFCNGGGRIFHALKKQLHDFSRLIGVINYYESLCRFNSATTSIALSIRSVQAGEWDIDYLKALLGVISLYPVGISLQMSTGYICKVIDVNPKAFKTPTVRSIFTMTDDHLFPIDIFETIDLHKNTKVKILGEVEHSALKSDIAIGF